MIEKEITESKNFVIKEPLNLVLIEFLNDFLDNGESEVIALAKENGIDNVIIDEAKGRKIPTRHHLNVIGSLGILVVAKKKGLIESVKVLINQMELNGIRIGNELKKVILEKADEL